MATTKKPARKATTETPNATPALDFDLAPDRDTVRKNGQLYELRSLDDFGVAAQQRLRRDGREFGELFNSPDELTEDQEQRLTFLLDRMFRQVLDAPADVLDSLSDSQRSQVVVTFTIAPLKNLTAEQLQTIMEARDGSSTTAT